MCYNIENSKGEMFMATIFYTINGQTIDMTQVYEATKTGSFTRIIVELQKALMMFPSYNDVGVKTLAMEIYHNKRMPTEEEVEEAVNGISQERLHASIVQHEQTQTVNHVPKCPTCGSTKLTKQTVMSRGISGFLFGRHSVEGRAQFLCDNCGYQW